jgi:cyclophilin family peptidyl-prolyl cis-trans isomerase
MKKITNILLILTTLIFLTGCNSTKTVEDIIPSPSSDFLGIPASGEPENVNLDGLNLNNENQSAQQAAEQKEVNMNGPKVLSKPQMQINTSKSYTATLLTTQGNITIKLYADKTPITVNNFVYLASQNFYDNTIFHRVVKDFMIQGGDPNGDGSGGPGYKFDDEPFEGSYSRGTVAMANAGPNTNGSQFFIMHQDKPLSKDYVIFGEVIEGMDVVDKIAEAPTTPNQMGENSVPVNPVSISSVQITEE